MATPTPRIYGATLPYDIVTLRHNGTVLNLSSGWTFLVEVGTPASPAVVSKSSGITGAAAAPNVTVAWTAADMVDLTPGDYTVEVTATRTSDSAVAKCSYPMTVVPEVDEVP